MFAPCCRPATLPLSYTLVNSFQPWLFIRINPESFQKSHRLQLFRSVSVLIRYFCLKTPPHPKPLRVALEEEIYHKDVLETSVRQRNWISCVTRTERLRTKDLRSLGLSFLCLWLSLCLCLQASVSLPSLARCVLQLCGHTTSLPLLRGCTSVLCPPPSLSCDRHAGV